MLRCGHCNRCYSYRCSCHWCWSNRCSLIGYRCSIRSNSSLISIKGSIIGNWCMSRCLYNCRCDRCLVVSLCWSIVMNWAYTIWNSICYSLFLSSNDFHIISFIFSIISCFSNIRFSFFSNCNNFIGRNINSNRCHFNHRHTVLDFRINLQMSSFSSSNLRCILHRQRCLSIVNLNSSSLNLESISISNVLDSLWDTIDINVVVRTFDISIGISDFISVSNSIIVSKCICT